MATATLFDLPPQDILFTHIFSHLDLFDIWTLRLTCKELHGLCWDYLINACECLSVILAHSSSHTLPHSSIGLGAGITILKNCNKLHNLEIISLPEVELDTKSVQKLWVVLVDSDCALKRLCFRGVNLCDLVPLTKGLSRKCSELRELELCGPASEGEVSELLSQLLQHCKHSLQRLSIENITLCPTQPLLPIQSLTELKYFSVAYCHRISSEGCIEELFRNSPLLEVVDLRYVETVCDRTLLFLTEYCTNLKQLYIKGCPLVTMESLVRLHDEKGVQIDVPFTRLRAKKCMVKFLMPV